MKLRLYIANRQTNSMMVAADLCPPYKVFVTPIEDDVVRNGTDSDQAFVERIIKHSKAEKDYWIPAVMCNGMMYVDASIKEISDGHRSVFV